jgi:hypothetical protein
MCELVFEEPSMKLSRVIFAITIVAFSATVIPTPLTSTVYAQEQPNNGTSKPASKKHHGRHGSGKHHKGKHKGQPTPNSNTPSTPTK